MVDNFFTPNGMLDSMPPLLKEVGNVLEEVSDELGQVCLLLWPLHDK